MQGQLRSQVPRRNAGVKERYSRIPDVPLEPRGENSDFAAASWPRCDNLDLRGSEGSHARASPRHAVNSTLLLSGTQSH